MKADVKTLDNKKAGTVELDDGIFGAPVRSDILHRMVRWQLARRRGGTRKTRTLSETRGTGAKMYRQKGTGRARHGTAKVSQFRGGAKTFGPVVRDHAHKLPKKVRRLALLSALSAKQAEGRLVVLDTAVLKDGKTASLIKQLDALGWRSALIVDGATADNTFARAARNVPHVDILPAAGANVYDILRHDTLALTRAAVESLEARLK